MKIQFLAFAVVFFCSSLVDAEQTFNYPADEPIFSISFPDAWVVGAAEEGEEDEGQSLTASPKDESVYSQLIALDAKDAANALKEAQAAFKEEFENLKIDETQKGEINGLKVSLFNATSVNKDGEKVILNCALFVPPKGETYFMLFFVATPESSKKHGADISKVLQSIKAK